MFFIDVQGTLIDDIKREPIDGAIEFIDKLNKLKIPYVVVTNNTKHKSEEFLKYLNDIGFSINSNSYIDPLMVLNEIVKEKDILAFGTEEFLNILEDNNFNLNTKNPKAVIVSVKKDFNNEEFAIMIEALLNGAKLFGMHQTTLYAKDGKRYPGVGAILEMLKFATNKEFEIVGKPSVNFYQKAKEKLKAKNFSDITIISDDVKGDLIGAKELGLKTVFVLSGKYRDVNEIIPLLKEEQKPDLIYESIKGYKESLWI